MFMKFITHVNYSYLFLFMSNFSSFLLLRILMVVCIFYLLRTFLVVRSVIIIIAYRNNVLKCCLNIMSNSKNVYYAKAQFTGFPQ